MKKKEFPIKGWKWIFYIIGWLGVLNVAFWIYQVVAYALYNSEDKFFTNHFHRRVFNWGILITITIALAFLIAAAFAIFVG